MNTSNQLVFKRNEKPFKPNAPIRIEEVCILWKPGFTQDEPETEGCTAVATVSRPIGQGNRRLQCFSSSGLWGIDERCESYEVEQLDDLREHLKAFNIPWFNEE